MMEDKYDYVLKKQNMASSPVILYGNPIGSQCKLKIENENLLLKCRLRFPDVEEKFQYDLSYLMPSWRNDFSTKAMEYVNRQHGVVTANENIVDIVCSISASMDVIERWLEIGNALLIFQNIKDPDIRKNFIENMKEIHPDYYQCKINGKTDIQVIEALSEFIFNDLKEKYPAEFTEFKL